MQDLNVQSEAILAQRLVAADGRFNFRDIGGYETEDGHIVRWGRVYRSGLMAHLSDAGCASLARLGIRLIFDLRTTTERQDAPTLWQTIGARDYWCRDYDHSDSDIQRMMRDTNYTFERARAAMIEDYQTLAFEQAEAYRELFARIAAGHLPVVFNCSAGKDRTGVAAALLLTLLGVPRHSVVADYLLTNEVMPRDAAPLVKRGRLKGWRDDECYAPLLRADREYLAAMFAAIEGQFGCVDNYLRGELAIDPQRREAIRQQMLERL